MKDARGHGSNPRGGTQPLQRVDSGGIWNRVQNADGSITATHEATGKVLHGDRGLVDEQMGHFGMMQAMARAGVGGQQKAHDVAAKHGIPTGHLVSGIQRAYRSVKSAFRNSMG